MNIFASVSVIAMTFFTINVFDIAECLPSGSRSDYRIVHLHKNKENFKEHECATPKPQLHYIGEDLETEKFRGMKFYPPAVVVNRCSVTTGCCVNGGNCTVDVEELVIFQVEIVINDGTSEISIPISNHLACKCIEEKYIGER